jgi:hypothetical protein
VAEQLHNLIDDLVKVHTSPSLGFSPQGMSQYYGSAYQNRGLISIAIGRHSGDFWERFFTRLHTCSPASHPVLEGVTSPQRGEARSLSTLLWTTTREVLFKKSPQGCYGAVLTFDP